MEWCREAPHRHGGQCSHGSELGALLRRGECTRRSSRRGEQRRRPLSESSPAVGQALGRGGLERELDRKEKALAEAAALLVLKRKVQEICGDEDDTTDSRSDR